MQGAHRAAQAGVLQREEGDQVAHPWLPSPPSRLSHPAREAARFPSRLSLPVDPVDPAAALLLLPWRPYRPRPRQEQTGEHLQRNETMNVTKNGSIRKDRGGRGRGKRRVGWLVDCDICLMEASNILLREKQYTQF